MGAQQKWSDQSSSLNPEESLPGGFRTHDVGLDNLPIIE